MISVPKYVRITQTKEQDAEYTVYNSKTGEEYEINQILFDILREINEKNIFSIQEAEEIACKYVTNYKEIIETLLAERVLIPECKEASKNLLNPKEIDYPLTTVTIELTNCCSLRCIHCYGAFGRIEKEMHYSLGEIQKLKKELDYLHVKTIVLSGGDLFLNKEFAQITYYLLENGFEVSILSNGWIDITSFCESVRDYKLSMVFSIDGFEKKHDFIRGRRESYNHVMNALKIANKYQNISVGINTTVMRENVDEIEELHKYIRKLYPNISINSGLIIPVDGGTQSFEEKEFEGVYAVCPQVFESFDKGKERVERCQGGISLCSLAADGSLYLCAAARDDKFLFGNIFTNSLTELWLNPPNQIKKMRKEKHLERIKCQQCDRKEFCKTIQDCRIYADKYAKGIDEANPITCFVASKKDKEYNCTNIQKPAMTEKDDVR